ANGVKPTRSANRTVTTRRSATRAGAAAAGTVAADPDDVDDEADVAGPRAVPTGAPQSAQKRASGSSGLPQLAHTRPRRIPHWMQNFAPGLFCAPQLEQTIRSQPPCAPTVAQPAAPRSRRCVPAGLRLGDRSGIIAIVRSSGNPPPPRETI